MGYLVVMQNLKIINLVNHFCMQITAACIELKKPECTRLVPLYDCELGKNKKREEQERNNNRTV